MNRIDLEKINIYASDKLNIYYGLRNKSVNWIKFSDPKSQLLKNWPPSAFKNIFTIVSSQSISHKDSNELYQGSKRGSNFLGTKKFRGPNGFGDQLSTALLSCASKYLFQGRILRLLLLKLISRQKFRENFDLRDLFCLFCELRCQRLNNPSEKYVWGVNQNQRFPIRTSKSYIPSKMNNHKKSCT